MKARKTGTFNDIQSFYFREATHLVGQSISVMILALNEEYGFGAERLKRLIDRYAKINRRLNDYNDNARVEAELRTRLEKLGLKEFSDAMLRMHQIEEYRQEVKIQNKVSLKEAAEAQKNLQLMLKLQKGNVK